MGIQSARQLRPFPQKMSKPEPTTTTKAPTPKCYLLQSPNEIIIEVASYLKLRHVYSFLNTSYDLQTILHIFFYNRAYSFF